MNADPIQAKQIFLQALQSATPAQREALLQEACGGDDTLRHQVDLLLDAHEHAGSFLEKGALAVGQAIDQPLTEKPATQIGPYKIIQEIGEGGMGLVFMALQKAPVRRKVALKIIKPGMDTREVIARFEAEQQALALMDHPNIAKVLDAGTTESGRPYFVMEAVNGVPITESCDTNNLPTRERLELFILLCHAVQHAHQKGIIHRDLKPSNILVTLHDGVPVPKIIDFGIAKATNQELTTKTLATGLGHMVGTPLYMSPEQAERSGLDIDTRSDIYSLRVLLYELLTGSTPFDREQLKDAGLDEVRRLIREQEPPRPSTRISTLGKAATTVSEHRKTDPAELSNSLRHELDWIVMKALEKDRARRYETAKDFARDMERYLNDEAVEACPPSNVYRLRKFARRNRVAVSTTAAIGLALLLGTGIATGQAIRATKAEEIADQQLQIAQRQERLAQQQMQLAKVQKRIAEDERQLAMEMLALATGGIDGAALNAAPDGSLYVHCRTGQVLRCDAMTGVLVGEFAYFARQEPVSRYQRLVVGHDLTGDGQAELYAVGYETVRILDGASGKSIQVFTRKSGSVATDYLGRDDICVGPDGLFYDLCRGEVRRYDGRALQFVDTIVRTESPTTDGDTSIDGGTFAFGPDGNLYAAVWGLQNVVRFDGRTGRQLDEYVRKDVRRLRDPRGMAFGPDGNLYVVTAKSLLLYGGAGGRLLREIPAELGQQFCGLFFQPAGDLYVSANDQLLRFDAASGLEPFLRYHELLMHYLARRVGDEPGLRNALQGSELQNTLAWSLVWQRGACDSDAKLGIELAAAAVRDAPNNGPIWHTLGVAYYRAGRWEEARQALRRSDALCGPTAYVSFFLSMAYARLNDPTRARAEYDRGCQLLCGWEHQIADDDAEPRSPQRSGGEMEFRGLLGLLSGFQKEAAEVLQIDVEAETAKESRRQ